MSDDMTEGRRSWRRPRTLLRLAVANLAVGLVVLLAAGDRKTAEVWYKADANSLVGLQAFVEQKLDPDEIDPTLYFDYVLPVLELPAWVAAIVLLTLFDALRLAAACAVMCAWTRLRRERD